jgi:ComF family protein
MSLLTKVFDGFLNDCFDLRCYGCNARSEKALCAKCACFPLFHSNCQACGAGMGPISGHCRACEPAQESSFLIQSKFWLNDTALKLLHRIKLHGYQEWMSLLASHLSIDTRLTEPSSPCLIPVPMHYARYLQRGFNQSEWLANKLASVTGLTHCRRSLRKTRSSLPQSTLQKKERARNLKNVFSWTGTSAPPENVILVDDVFTTGNTMQACRGVLLRNGARNVRGWTLFRTPRTRYSHVLREYRAPAFKTS